MKDGYSIFIRFIGDNQFIQWRYKGRFTNAPEKITEKVNKEDFKFYLEETKNKSEKFKSYKKYSDNKYAFTNRILLNAEDGKIYNSNEDKFKHTHLHDKVNESNKRFAEREKKKRTTEYTPKIRNLIKKALEKSPTKQILMTRIRYMVILFRYVTNDLDIIIENSPEMIVFSDANTEPGLLSLQEIAATTKLGIDMQHANELLEAKEYGFTRWYVEMAEGRVTQYFKGLTLKKRKRSGNIKTYEFNPLKFKETF